MSDKSGKGGQAVIAWIVAIVTAGYMLPWAIAATRGKSNSGAIGWINLLLGWSIIGWIVALVMACSAHRIVAVRSF
ncbi:superinfection immunity protein [Aeromicrobium sp. UC242_57]|uniref:superinfection immunity protein n=1 Tax=Aeromicrobium sp. UC242_57 TaxID=3374624 RepID=UPI0037AB61A4